MSYLKNKSDALRGGALNHALTLASARNRLSKGVFRKHSYCAKSLFLSQNFT